MLLFDVYVSVVLYIANFKMKKKTHFRNAENRSQEQIYDFRCMVSVYTESIEKL